MHIFKHPAPSLHETARALFLPPPFSSSLAPAQLARGVPWTEDPLEYRRMGLRCTTNQPSTHSVGTHDDDIAPFAGSLPSPRQCSAAASTPQYVVIVVIVEAATLLLC